MRINLRECLSSLFHFLRSAIPIALIAYGSYLFFQTLTLDQAFGLFYGLYGIVLIIKNL